MSRAACDGRGVPCAVAARGRSAWTRFPVARLHFTNPRACGRLVKLARRNLRFHVYDLAAPMASVAELLNEIERDPTAIFWG